jgi:ubiquinone/menaquinone biosynthesis C-methylase UbiE
MNPAAKRDYFNALAQRWDSIPQPPDAGERVGRFLANVVRPGDRRILDIGCGTGLLVSGLLDGPRRIVELDFAFEMLAGNKRKHADSRVGYVCADAARLPFRGACFDLVLCFGIVPHLERPEPALKELLGLLHPGGRLAVGHLMGSETLNAFHASLDGPVNRDHLPAAAELALMFENLGARVVTAAEAADSYLVSVEK